MVTVRATVVQASSVFYDTPATIDKAWSLVEEAVSKGARLVVFPEAFIGGYPHGVVISGRSTNGKVDFDKYHAAAIDVPVFFPGPEVERIGAIARNFNVCLVMGAIERLRFHLYSTVLFFDSQGQSLGMQRKLISTPLELSLWDIGDESTIPVYETSIGKIGALISWENRMPLLRMALYDKDIQIYCALTSDAREVWQASMTNIALEGGCFVLSANQFCRRRDYPPPPDYKFVEPVKEPHPDSVVCAGGSVIISPSGVVLAGPNYDGEALITADLDLNENRKAKLDFDVVGVNSRLSSLSP